MSDARKYGTTNPVLIEARINHDPYDQFAWVQGWRFALCDYLTEHGEHVPDFRQAFNGPETDAFEYEQLEYMNATVPDAWYALKILDRYREWLRIAGKDY
jgi:hypothetical protein